MENKTFAEIYNQNKIFDINTENYEFIKLSELYALDASKMYVINGFWVNNSKYGKQTILIVSSEKKLINLPMFLTQTFETILTDCNAINTIKNNKVGFVIYTYEKNKKTYYSIKFVDIQ